MAASAAPSAAASPTAAALTGSLTVWESYGSSGGTAEKDAFDKMVANVMAANPGLTVTVTDVPFANLFTNFETQAGAGSGPDLYIAPNDSLPKEARAGLLADESALIPTLQAAPYNSSQVSIDASTVDGKLYEIPESMKAVELFYNNTMLTLRAGHHGRLDDQRQAARLGLRRQRRRGLLPVGHLQLLRRHDHRSDHRQVRRRPGRRRRRRATSGLHDMKAAGMHFYQSDGDAKADLLSGKIAGFIDGPWESGDLTKALGAKLSVVAGPTGPGGDWAPLTAPDGYYINSASPNAALAAQFALQMLQPANEQLLRERRPPAGEHDDSSPPTRSRRPSRRSCRRASPGRRSSSSTTTGATSGTPSTPSSTRGPTRPRPSPTRARP